MACGASELVIPLTEIYALLQDLESWVKDPSTSNDITIYGPEKAGVGITVDYSTALITGIMDMTIYGNTVKNLIANGKVTTSLLSDDSGTNIGLETDGTWSFNNAYSATEQNFNGSVGDRVLIMTRLKADSVGRIKKQYVNYSDTSVQEGTTVVDSLYMADIITLNSALSFNIKLQESTAGTIERDYQILINLTQYNTSETDLNILAQMFQYSEGIVSVDKQRILISSKNLFDINEAIFDGFRINETTGGLTASTDRGRSDYISVKGSTTYSQSNGGAVSTGAFYDENFNYISNITLSVPFTTPSNCRYVRLSIVIARKDAMQLELGSSATEFEAHEETLRLIDGPLSRLSSGTSDWVDNKGNVERKISDETAMSGADFESYQDKTNIAVLIMSDPENHLDNINVDIFVGTYPVNLSSGEGLTMDSGSAYDNVANIGKFFTTASGSIRYVVTKSIGIAAARIVVEGKLLQYEKAIYTGALEKQPTSPLIIYKDGQATKTPWYADSGITVGDKLTLTKPISKIYKAWEWIDDEMVIIDPADLTLDTSTQVDIAGAISGHIIYLEGYLLTENVAVSKGVYTAPYNGGAQIEGNMKNIVLLSKKQMEIERKVDMVVTGDAEIHLSDGSTAQSIPTGAGYEKLINFDSNGIASIGVPDYVNNKITLPKGIYRVFVTVSFTIGTNNTKFFVAAFMGGAEQHQVHFTRELATGADTASTSACGLIHVTADDTEIDIRARHDDGGAVNITLNYANLNVEKRG